MYLGLFMLIFLPMSAIYGQAYQYPILPGTEKWSTLDNHQAMVDACQIPIDILQKMTTKDLVETCVNYPLKTDLYSYSTIKEGIEKVASKFNGFKDLFKREDNYTYLFDFLGKSRTTIVKEIDSEMGNIEKGEIIYNISLVETLLSFDDILQHSNGKQKNALIELSRELLDFKMNSNGKFSNYSITSSALLLGIALQKVSPNTSISRNMEKFLAGKMMLDETILQEMNQMYKNSK